MFVSALVSGFLVWRLAYTTPFLVQGPSMEPTVHNGTLFALDTLAYRLGFPERGDIVVFHFEDDPDYFYVKRIVGLPGERVHVATDGVYLEDQGGLKSKLLEPYLANAASSATGKSLKNGYKDETFVVPPGKYMVMGDNRADSLDSRFFKHPFIPREDIQGKYLFTLLGS
jgi:signal peptidase I